MMNLLGGFWIEGVGEGNGFYVSRSVRVKERMMYSQFV